jgi:hypothetical protein
MILAAILRNQGRRPLSILGLALTSITGTFSVLSASKYGLPGNWASAIAFASVTSQQLLSSIKPVTTVDQIDKFETQVLEPSFLLDGGACEQRTLFTVLSPRTKSRQLSFHVR